MHVRKLQKAYLTTDVGMIHFGHKLDYRRREGIIFFEVDEQFEVASFEWRVIWSHDISVEGPVVGKHLIDTDIIIHLLLINNSIREVPSLDSVFQV